MGDFSYMNVSYMVKGRT